MGAQQGSLMESWGWAETEPGGVVAPGPPSAGPGGKLDKRAGNWGWDCAEPGRRGWARAQRAENKSKLG